VLCDLCRDTISSQLRQLKYRSVVHTVTIGLGYMSDAVYQNEQRNAVITIAIRLQYDYDTTTTSTYSACFQFDASKK